MMLNLVVAFGIIAAESHAVALLAPASAPQSTGDPEFYLKRGEALSGAHEYDRAIADYTTAIQLKPDYAEAYNDRGFAYYLKGDGEHAIADFTRAIELRPDYPKAYNSRGVAYMSHGYGAAKSVPDFDRAIALKPDFRYAYINRANARLLSHPRLALQDFHHVGMYPERTVAKLGGAVLVMIAGVAWIRRRRACSAASKSAALVGVITAIAVASCGGTAPTSPGGATNSGADVLGVDVSCPPSLLIGQRGPCVAVARLRSGQTPIVSFEATWSSNHPEVVTVDAQGLASGKSAGQATVSASYRDRKADVTVAVTAEDALRIDSGQAHQGDFTPGSTVTMWLQGYYSVTSAETGRLSLRILSDQTRIIATTPPVTVAKGGDFFLLSSTFVVPGDSVEVCRTAVLEVGSVTITEPKSKSSPLWCIPIRR